jgi:hypothetical protein
MLETLSIRPVLVDLLRSEVTIGRCRQSAGKAASLRGGILRGHTPDTILSRRIVKIWSSPVATRRISNGPKVTGGE